MSKTGYETMPFNRKDVSIHLLSDMFWAWMDPSVCDSLTGQAPFCVETNACSELSTHSL